MSIFKRIANVVSRLARKKKAQEPFNVDENHPTYKAFQATVDATGATPKDIQYWIDNPEEDTNDSRDIQIGQAHHALRSLQDPKYMKTLFNIRKVDPQLQLEQAIMGHEQAKDWHEGDVEDMQGHIRTNADKEMVRKHQHAADLHRDAILYLNKFYHRDMDQDQRPDFIIPEDYYS